MRQGVEREFDTNIGNCQEIGIASCDALFVLFIEKAKSETTAHQFSTLDP